MTAKPDDKKTKPKTPPATPQRRYQKATNYIDLIVCPDTGNWIPKDENSPYQVL